MASVQPQASSLTCYTTDGDMHGEIRGERYQRIELKRRHLRRRVLTTCISWHHSILQQRLATLDSLHSRRLASPTGNVTLLWSRVPHCHSSEASRFYTPAQREANQDHDDVWDFSMLPAIQALEAFSHMRHNKRHFSSVRPPGLSMCFSSQSGHSIYA